MRTALVLCLLCGISACSRQEVPTALGGDPDNGRLLLRQYACGSCHRIPGVVAADGKVGPPLDGIARQAYLGGVAPNTPEQMAAFIRSPRQFDPRTAMPDMGVQESQSRDMVAYLYGLK